jgi:hypothetical protein
MQKKAIFVLIALLCGLSSYAEDDQGGLIYGDTWAILAAPPSGWVWDSRTLRSQGIGGLYYKAGGHYDAFALHMLIEPREKAPGEALSLPGFIAQEETAIKARSPGASFGSLSSMTTPWGYEFELCDMDDPMNASYKAFAYYDGEGAFFSFVLACGSPEEREAERGALLELLGSFTYAAKE